MNKYQRRIKLNRLKDDLTSFQVVYLGNHDIFEISQGSQLIYRCSGSQDHQEILCNVQRIVQNKLTDFK